MTNLIIPIGFGLSAFGKSWCSMRNLANAADFRKHRFLCCSVHRQKSRKQTQTFPSSLGRDLFRMSSLLDRVRLRTDRCFLRFKESFSALLASLGCFDARERKLHCRHVEVHQVPSHLERPRYNLKLMQNQIPSNAVR